MIVLGLAVRDLIRDRFFFLCNVAVIVGVLAPLLVLFGVKNGVYQALIGEMMANPATLQIDTLGNNSFTDSQIETLRSWPDVIFVTPKVRSQFDYVHVYVPKARERREAVLIPSGTGDPTLPEGIYLYPDTVAVSPQLADQLQIGLGDRIELVTQAEDRPRQLALSVTVAAILRPDVSSGSTVLAPYKLLDTIEAFYDAYALPDHGITEGRPLAERVPSYEGIRVYGATLAGLGALQSRIDAELSSGTRAKTREVEALLGLGRNLDLALGLVTTLATAGLFAALVFSFWSDVLRKQATLAGIALLGVPPAQLALFPLVQGLAAALAGLMLSFSLFVLAGALATRLFGAGLPADRPIAVIGPMEAGMIASGVIGVVVLATLLAARSAQRMDPASVLREGA
jgi:putative ABC transport system permease protein